MSDTIKGLLGEWAMLNPAYLEDCTYEGDTYQSIIMAVEASKFPKEKRAPFINGTAQAAQYGFARPYSHKQLEVLTSLLEERFKLDNKFRKCLMRTGDSHIVYDNNLHRNWYGACDCKMCASVESKNHVGKILEQIRDAAS